MQVRIELVQSHQVGLLLGLIRQLAEYERRLDQVQAAETDLRAALFCEGSPVRAVLAWVGHEAVGYALYYPVFSTFRGRFALYLEDIFVVPAYRGQGIGLALMRYLAQEALRQGYDRIEWQVLDWNTPAIEFYRRLGATPKETEWVPYKLEGEVLRRLAE